jgi:hypothetical protein
MGDLSGFLASANLAQHGEALGALGCTEVADLHVLTDDDCASAAMKPLEIRRMRRKLGEIVAGGAGLAAHEQQLTVPGYDVSPHPTVATSTPGPQATAPLHVHSSSNKEQPPPPAERSTNEIAARLSSANPASLLANNMPSLTTTLLQDQPVAAPKSGKKPAIIGAAVVVVLALLAIVAITLFTQIDKKGVSNSTSPSPPTTNCVDVRGVYDDVHYWTNGQMTQVGCDLSWNADFNLGQGRQYSQGSVRGNTITLTGGRYSSPKVGTFSTDDNQITWSDDNHGTWERRRDPNCVDVRGVYDDRPYWTNGQMTQVGCDLSWNADFNLGQGRQYSQGSVRGNTITLTGGRYSSPKVGTLTDDNQITWSDDNHGTWERRT